MSHQHRTIEEKTNRCITGYTLVELLIVIAVISIVLGLPFLSMINNRHDATLDTAEALVVQALKSARSKAMSGVKNMSGVAGESYGVCFNAQNATVFEVSSHCVCGSCTGTTYQLPPSVTVDTKRIEFERLTGASTPENIHISAYSDTRIVSIQNNGFIE